MEMSTSCGTKEYVRAIAEAQEALARGDDNRLIVCKSRGNLPFIFSTHTFISFAQSEPVVDARELIRKVSSPVLIVRGTRDLPP